MKTQSPALIKETMPTLFEDFFKPWNEWFDGGNFWKRSMNVPAVNITEQEKEYQVELAAPGMKKEDFRIDIDGNLLTISSEKEEKQEETNKKFTRKEYSYAGFSRCFTLPEEVNKEKIEAAYDNGLLKITLPRNINGKNSRTNHIEVK